MQQLGASSAPGPVKAIAKKMLIGEEYDFVDVDVPVVLPACAKVFKKGVFRSFFEAEEPGVLSIQE